jgi:restriction system protein
MIPIYSSEPSDWRDLQDKTAKIYADLGYETTIEKDIQTARGIVNVDVFCTKSYSYLIDINIVECKHWTNPVPKTIVHAFRSVITDSGANTGYIISRSGFQSGAFEAAQNSNIKLLTFDDFQTAFRTRWLDAVIDRIEEVGYPLRKYCDPMETFAAREYDQLSEERQTQISQMMRKYYNISMNSMRLLYKDVMSGKLMLEYIDERIIENCKDFPGMKINCLMDYFNIMHDTCVRTVNEFDEAYGKRLRKRNKDY